ncbi:MAG TPA: ABC transporter substrate-binding protein [Gaiellaceae bacterium]
MLVPLAGARPSTAPAIPKRIVSLSPTATEDLFALGAGKQVVAVDDQSNYPTSAPKTKLSGYTPNAEAIAVYNPDLVVISEDANGLTKALGKLHIPVILQTPASGIAGTYAQIAALGRATGHSSGAASLIARMKSRIAGTVASIPKGHSLSFYEELSPDYYSATSTTFAGQMLKLLGLKDIADAAKGSGSGYPKLSAEYIVAADPALIVLADTRCCAQTPASVKGRAGWSSIAAIRNGAIVPVSDDIASRWGPRIVDFLEAVAAKVRAIDAQSK